MRRSICFSITSQIQGHHSIFTFKFPQLMAPRIPNKGEKKVGVTRSSSMIPKCTRCFCSQIAEGKLAWLCLQWDSFFLSVVCWWSFVATVVLCSPLEFPSKEARQPERGHGQSLDVSTVPGLRHDPFAAKEAGINQSTQRTILFYPWSCSIIKKSKVWKAFSSLWLAYTHILME